MTKHIEIDFIQEKLLSKEVCQIEWSTCRYVNKIIERTLNWIYLFQACHIQFVCFSLRGVLEEVVVNKIYW